MAKERNNTEDTSAYGDDTKQHILDDANYAVNPFKPGELDRGEPGLGDNPDHDKSLGEIVDEGKK